MKTPFTLKSKRYGNISLRYGYLYRCKTNELRAINNTTKYKKKFKLNPMTHSLLCLPYKFSSHIVTKVKRILSTAVVKMLRTKMKLGE